MFSDPVETGYGGASQGAVGADANILPDVAQDTVTHAPSTLEWVGMRAIETAIRYRTENGEAVRAPALADAFVSLDDANARGIHMSRLYLALDQTLEEETFSIDTLGRLLENFVLSHSDLSRSASVKIAFDYLRRRGSLLSGREAWRTYPVEFQAESLEGKVTRTLKVRLVYSSACPCSTALSGALMQKRFETEFAGRTSVPLRQAAHWIATVGAVTAIPHSQRSHGEILVRLDDSVAGPFDAVVDRIIDGIEEALGTAVQAAVKRADEQEFARLNGMNAMFCEDAARRMKQVLEEFPGILDYRAEARHFRKPPPARRNGDHRKGHRRGLPSVSDGSGSEESADDGSLTLAAAQAEVDAWIRSVGVRYFSELSNLAQLVEEVGEVARLVSRKYGEQSFKSGETPGELSDELADVLFVLICLANQTGVDLSAAFRANLDKKTRRDAERHRTNPKLRDS